MIIKLPNSITEDLNYYAKKSNHSRFKHCAIIYDYKNKIMLSYGYNYLTSKNQSIHAEEMAIEKSRFYFRNGYNLTCDCVLIVCRLKNHKFKNSLPCHKCQKLINEMGFRLILYSTNKTNLEDLTIEI